MFVKDFFPLGKFLNVQTAITEVSRNLSRIQRLWFVVNYAASIAHKIYLKFHICEYLWLKLWEI